MTLGRQSWDTSIKHLARHNLLKDVLSQEMYGTIPSSNLSRWRNEPKDKYRHSELNAILEKEIELIRRINQFSNIKAINTAYFKLCDTFLEIIKPVKGVKSLICEQKERIVNSI